MLVNFMINKSPEIQVNKTVSATQPVDCQLKENCDMINPTFIVYGVDITSFNYFQVPDFGNRYYFVVPPLMTRNENTFEVTGQVDVLMSFKEDILNANGIIERNENEFMKYITDSKYTVLNYERIQTKLFPNSFPTNGEFVLIVAGS